MLHGKRAVEKKNDVYAAVFCGADFNYDSKLIFMYHQSKAILLLAHRIFNYMFTVEAHKEKIIVFNFQHGFYITRTVTSQLSASFFLSYFDWMLVDAKVDKVK